MAKTYILGMLYIIYHIIYIYISHMILLINMNEYTIEDVTVGMIFPIYPGRKIQVLM